MKVLFIRSYSRCLILIFISLFPYSFHNLAFCYPTATQTKIRNPMLSPPRMEREIKRFGKAVVISDGDEEESYVIPSGTWCSKTADYSLTLLGRVCTRKIVNFDYLSSTLNRAIQPVKGMSLSPLHRQIQWRQENRNGVPQFGGPRRNLSAVFRSDGGSPMVSSAGPQLPQRLDPGNSGGVDLQHIPDPSRSPTDLEQVKANQLGLTSSPGQGGFNSPQQNIIPGVGPAFNSAHLVTYSQAQHLLYNLSPNYHQEPTIPYVPQHVRPNLTQSMDSNITPPSFNQPVHSPEAGKKSQTPESKTSLSSSSVPDSSETLRINCTREDVPRRKRGKKDNPQIQLRWAAKEADSHVTSNCLVSGIDATCPAATDDQSRHDS